jgi:hypothetical protein
MTTGNITLDIINITRQINKSNQVTDISISIGNKTYNSSIWDPKIWVSGGKTNLYPKLLIYNLHSKQLNINPELFKGYTETESNKPASIIFPTSELFKAHPPVR